MSASLYAPLFEGTVQLVDGCSDRELERMIDLLEKGTALVERELEKLERRRSAP